MASTNLDNLGLQPQEVPSWELGINTAKPPTEIDDREVRDLLNLEFDDAGNLSTRRSITQLNANTFTGRITSLHYFTTESGEVGILFTNSTKLYIVQTNGTGQTDLTAALTFPNDTFWQWVTFGGIAIGVNKATSGTNPVKVTTVPAAAALGGSPPKGKYTEDWTTTGAAGTITLDIDPNDGDLIMGLFATKEVLYIFKRKRIYTLTASALPNTDPNNLRVDVFTQKIGCASPYSIQQVPNDVVFLSDQGVASLALVQTAEDFRTAFYSRKVAELERFVKSTDEIPSLLCDTAAQYWLSLPATVSPTGKENVYVLDYLKVDEQIVRWTRFDGLAAGSAFTSFLGASGKTFVIGAKQIGTTNTYQLFTYIPRLSTAGFSDNVSAYTKAITMKSFNGGAQLLKKYFHEWALEVNLLSATAQLQVQYYFDGNILRGDSYSFALMGTTTGALWAGGLWGAGLWGTTFAGQFDIVRELKSNNFGREAQDVTFNVSNSQNNEGFQLY